MRKGTTWYAKAFQQLESNSVWCVKRANDVGAAFISDLYENASDVF